MPCHIVGLTGSIGMGKSTVAQMLKELEVPINDADAAVHALYSKGGAAVGPVGALFPGVIFDGAVSRVELSKHVIGKPDNLKRLEAIVHPLVTASRDAFLAEMHASGALLAVLDIPLLFENGLERLCDAVLVVSAPAAAQRARVLARPTMASLPDGGVAKFEAILAKQLPDAEKRARPGVVVIDTGASLEATRGAVAAFVASRRQAVAARRRRIKGGLVLAAAVLGVAGGLALRYARKPKK